MQKRKKNRYKETKRFFDIVLSFLALILFSWIIVLLILFSSIDTRSFGVFKQVRIGHDKKEFTIYKIKTFNKTSSSKKQVSRFARLLRNSKLDELPQLINILIGNMSFVGPRPDVPGFADKLDGEDQIILSVKPGLTGPASIVFRNEEKILAKQKDPVSYNREVIWPKKVELNVKYVKELSFKKDIYYLVKTLF